MVDGRCSGLVKSLQPAPERFDFAPAPPLTESKAVDSSFPMTMTVGAIGFHNGTMSVSSANNRVVSPQGYFEIAADDAARLGIADGTLVKVTSAAGSSTGPARVSKRLQAGLLFAPYHFSDLNASSLLTRNNNLAGVKVEKG
jgi:formate dehydrogenase alpha subunit